MSEQIKDLIEKQIEAAGNVFATVDGAMRSTGHLYSGHLVDFLSLLFEVIQNQNHRIDGILEAYEDLRRRNQSLMDTLRRLRSEKGDCTHPLVKKGECPLCGAEVKR
jgi:hypothetical protein